MIGDTVSYLTPGYITLVAIVVLVIVQASIRINYALKVRAAGGVHAPMQAKNPFTGM